HVRLGHVSLMSFVSIITPAFRAESHLARAVASVRAQTHPNWEMIIVADDGADYASLLASQNISLEKLRFASTGGSGLGPSRARNIALDLARGDCIALLDADDAFHPEKLERLLPAALTHGVALSAMEFFDDATGLPLRNANKPHPGGLIGADELCLASLHSYSQLVINRARVPARWTETRHLWEDLLFALSCLDNAGQAWFEPLPLHRYYRRADSLCNAPEAARRFIGEAGAILASLEAGAPAFKNPAIAATLKRFLEGRLALEERFEAALHAGECVDYQDFMHQNLALFHRL
ncbi:MAG: glycosyltransferase family 2 protein, partial [Alphaproteobacteria bacterium]|nr:glycosyltransferase family 2 protein [Alphaproteobacteria bacterium]